MEKPFLSKNGVINFGVNSRDIINLGFGFNGEKYRLVNVGGADHTCSSCDYSEMYHHQSDQGLLGDIHFNAVTTPDPVQETCFHELERALNDNNNNNNNGTTEETVTTEPGRKAMRYPFSPALLRLLNDYDATSGLKRLNSVKKIKPNNGYVSIEATTKSSATSNNIDSTGRLSVEETMRLAGEMLIHQSSCSHHFPIGDQFSGSMHHDSSYHLSFSGLSDQEKKNVQLAEFLLAAAEMVSQQQYERASIFLDKTDGDPVGNPVERVIYYFSEALRERIGRETSKGLWRKKGLFDMEQALMTDLTALASLQGTPFPKIVQFAGIQTVIENVMEAKKIHIIDLGIRFGSHWTLLMEGLAARQDSQALELLKITAVGIICKDVLEETGKRLMMFAKSKKLPFCFKIVVVSDFLDLTEELLEVEPDETVAVFSHYVLRSMLPVPDRLEHVMKVIAKISPVVTVIMESDANHNSSGFADRFIEALLYYSAYFDCLAECLSYDERSRRIMERVFFGEGIRSIVVMEGEERKIRNMKLDVWRAFIERYGPEEMEFSMSSLYQANLLLKESPKWSQHCTLEMNGKGLVILWKGVPLHFVSAWKFS